MINQKSMITARNFAVATVAVLSIALAQGCASSVETRQDSPAVSQVEVDDQVRVVTFDGPKRQFTVTRVDTNGLYDEEYYVRFDEIAEIDFSNRAAEETPSRSTIAIAVLGVILALDALGVGDAD